MIVADPSFSRRGNAALCLGLIAAFVLALTLHGYLSRPTLDRYGDMYENYAWGALWQWGYFKHPPFFGWETAAWFLIFPHRDFWYFLLSGVNAGMALVAVWRIAARFGATGFQVLVLALAMVMPPISFVGLNFNANSAMTPIWAWLFLFYLRGLERGRLVDAAVTGVLAAVAMLTKYHSAVMLAALLLHALMDGQARKLLFSWFGLVAVAGFAVVLAPHIFWLVGNDFLPITYAAHQDDGEGPNLADSALFLVTPIGYSAISILIARSMRNVRDSFAFLPVSGVTELRASVEGRALIAFAVWPLLLTVLAGYLAGAELSAVWGIPFYTAYAVILALLVPSAYHEMRLRRAIGAIVLFLVIIVAVAPFWYRQELKIDGYYTAPLSDVAAEVDQRWEAAGGKPKAIVYGLTVLSNAVSFYSRNDLKALEDNSFETSKAYVTREQALQRGLIGLCQHGDDSCAAAVRAAMPAGVVPQSFTLEGFQKGVMWTFDLWLSPGR